MADHNTPPLNLADTTQLESQLAHIKAELSVMNNHRIVRINNNMWRVVGFQFVRGLALGFGTVVGASVLVSVVVFSLSKIDFIPIIGDWAGEIASEITAGQRGKTGIQTLPPSEN